MPSHTNNAQDSLFDRVEKGLPQKLPLVDADLAFWSRIDLGIDRDLLLAELIADIDWRQDDITVYGKTWRQPRLCAWYGDAGYRYSGITLEPRPWTERLGRLRDRVATVTGCEFNSVLLNYYRDQHDSMGMHSDDEPELGPQPAIASLSLGEERVFVLKHKTRKDSFRLPLASGSLLLMQGDTQRHWRHGINKLKRACAPRINLTFRQIILPGDHA